MRRLAQASSRSLSLPTCCKALAVVLLALAGCDGTASERKTGGAVQGNQAERPVAEGTHLPDDQELRQRVDRVLDFTLRRHLNAKVSNAWQVVHGVLAFGPRLQVLVDGKPVSALEYLLEGGQLAGWTLVPGDSFPEGQGLEAILEPGDKVGQGHEDQWLGYLSQIGLAPDRTIMVRGQQFTTADMVRQAQWDVYDGMEATWTLMAFSTYLPLDARWQAKNGQEWTLERLVAMEARQDLRSSACGGTHRLYGLCTAVNRYLESKQPLQGGWLEAENKIQEAVAAAQRYQNPDGSFSSNFFQGPGQAADVGVQINTTGHTLEFLMLALKDAQLRESWITKAVLFLCSKLEATRKLDLECGGLYHAAHGLVLYRQRRFGPWVPEDGRATSSQEEPAAPTIDPALGARQDAVRH